MKPNPEEMLICLKCGYEIERWTFLKNRKEKEFPVCPECKLELSFKVSPLLAESQHPAVPYIILVLLLLLGAAGIFSVRRYFAVSDSRKLVTQQASAGEMIYGGKTRARVPVDWTRYPYSYEKYWKGAKPARMDIMIQEDHQYIYRGNLRNAFQVEYDYSDSTGKKGKKYFELPESGGKAVLTVPSIPYIKGSKSAKLKISSSPAGSIQVEEA